MAVEITAIVPTCGCTAAVPGRRRLEPGEATDLKVELHAGEARGERITRIDVGYRTAAVRADGTEGTAEDIPLKTLALELTADVIPHYAVRPAALTFRPGDRVHEVRLAPNFGPGVTVEKATCPHPAFAIELLPAGTDGSVGGVRVRFDPSRWEGDFQRPRVTLATSSPFQARHDVGITVVPADSLVASEESNDFGPLADSDGG